MNILSTMSNKEPQEEKDTIFNLPIRVDAELRDQLQVVANRNYEGNLSMAIRFTIRRGLDIIENEEKRKTK